MRHARRWQVILVLCLAACSPLPAAAVSPAAPPAPTQAPPIPTSPAPASPRPTATTTIPSAPRVEVVARDLPGPDDLVLAADGSVWISDVVAGTVSRLGLDGSIHVVIKGLQSPEGLAFLPDGTLIIAEQGKNRLMSYDPSTGSLAQWIALPNLTKNPGVDGIAFEPQPSGPALIVPDSPNGKVLRIALAGNQESTLAEGFVRPVGAWASGDGSVWVVDETDPGPVALIHPDGTREEIARLPTPDDVVVDPSGNVFVTTLADRSVHWIDPSTGSDHVLAGNLGQPQGLAFDTSGNLLVADTGLHQILRLVLRGSPAGG